MELMITWSSLKNDVSYFNNETNSIEKSDRLCQMLAIHDIVIIFCIRSTISLNFITKPELGLIEYLLYPCLLYSKKRKVNNIFWLLQICRFCWNKIRTEGNGNCPACRSAYSENPADFKPLTAEEMAKIKAEKRQKDQAKKQKISENRKHLANVRVVQKNLVFVVGLSPRLADAEVLKKPEYFGKFGKMHKVAINLNTAYAGNQNQVSTLDWLARDVTIYFYQNITLWCVCI